MSLATFKKKQLIAHLVLLKDPVNQQINTGYIRVHMGEKAPLLQLFF